MDTQLFALQMHLNRMTTSLFMTVRCNLLLHQTKHCSSEREGKSIEIGAKS